MHKLVSPGVSGCAARVKGHGESLAMRQPARRTWNGNVECSFRMFCSFVVPVTVLLGGRRKRAPVSLQPVAPVKNDLYIWRWLSATVVRLTDVADRSEDRLASSDDGALSRPTA